MSFIKTLRILVLDDNDDVLKHFKANLETSISVDGMTTQITVVTVQVTLDKLQDDNYEISQSTIFAIANACNRPFSYIVSDFAFVGDAVKNNDLAASLETDGRGVEATDLTSGTVYQMDAIRKKYEALKSEKKLTCRQKWNFRRNFISHCGPIKVYTNSPEPFASYFSPMRITERKYEYKCIFRKAPAVDFILMHEIFYITPAVRRQFNSNSNGFRDYYSKLLGQRLKEEIHVIALESMVRKQHKLRFKETRTAYRKLTAAGIGFGAVVALVGEVVYHCLNGFREDVLKALAVFGFDRLSAWQLEIEVVFLLAIGVVVYFAFPAWGVRIAKQIESESDRLLDRGGLE